MVHGPGVLRGYHGNDDATRAARTDEGWLRTGDLMRRERLGLVRYVGRKKDVIKHGGYSVFSSEIEEVLRSHSGVLDAAAIGRPDPIKGEVPIAFVELAAEATVDAAALEQWASERLADYKTPQKVTILSSLPRTGTGKVAKALLRSQLEDFRSASALSQNAR